MDDVIRHSICYCIGDFKSASLAFKGSALFSVSNEYVEWFLKRVRKYTEQRPYCGL